MSKNKGKNKGHDNLIPIKKGERLNPNGRPKGRKNFKTLFYEAIERIATEKGVKPDEFEIQLVEQAIRKGFNGDKGFYADTMDRVHGKADQTVNQNITLPQPILDLNEVLQDNSNKKNSGAEQKD